MIFLLWLALVIPAHAVEPDEMLADPALEARARDISEELRCMVCQGESIDTSQASFAHDVRLVIREKIKAGDSNDAVIAYLRSRYGDTILLKPPFEPRTALLWLAPFIALVFGGLMVRANYRKSKSS